MTIAADTASNDYKVVACPDCGLMQHTPFLQPGMVASCSRCSATLVRAHYAPVLTVLVWSLTGLLLCLPAMLEPIFIVNAAGIVRSSKVDDTAIALFQDGFSPVALLVAIFTIILPLVWLGGLSLVLGCIELGHRPPWLGRLFRMVNTLDIWAMPDVFLMGAFVAYTRLQAVSTVQIGDGGWAYVGVALCSVIVRAKFDRHFLWQEILPDSSKLPVDQAMSCPHCTLILPRSDDGGTCPRCGEHLQHRRLGGAMAAAALVIASYLLYIPANLLPVLNVVRLGREQNSTIFAGGLELIHAGMWPLALIVFLASIAVPVFKLFGISWFLLAMRRKSAHHLVMRTKLFRIINAIGRWSNIDVFMIGLLAALVQFGKLTTIVPEPGALAFASVVLLTMFASHAFDARLMWDAAGVRNVE